MGNALWDRFTEIERRRAGHEAVFWGDRVWRFADLKQAALDAARHLAEGFDLQPGQRVMIVCDPVPEALAWVLGIWHRGGIPALVYGDSPPAHLSHIHRTTDAALVIADAALPDSGAIPRVEVSGLSPAADAPAPVPAERAGDLPGSIVFTSGSTGRPKGVTQSGATLLACSANLTALLGYAGRDRILCPVPFAFDYGWGQALTCLLQGIPLVLPRPRTSFGLCEALERHAPTILAGVPAVFADLAAGLAPIRQTDRSSVRLITNTGSKIPARVFEDLTDLFPDAALSLNYGLTETYRSASLPVGLARQVPDAVGHAVPGVDLFVLRPDGTEAALEEEGEIVHRGLGTFLGYWNEPERTAETLRPDPFGGPTPVVFTGDLGRVGSDGLLRIHGRRDRQMKSMGIRISPDEIEALLLESGLIADVGIVALPHDVLGDMVVACIVPKAAPEIGPDRAAAEKRAGGSAVAQRDAGPSDAALALEPRDMADRARLPSQKALLGHLRSYARTVMAQHMQPRRWLVFDALPRTRSGKVDYPALRRAAEARP